MAHRHVLSPVDHHLSECVDCNVLVPGPAPADLPECAAPGCHEDGPVLGPAGTPVCIWHDPNFDLPAARQGAA